jgi:hypothetical protein
MSYTSVNPEVKSTRERCMRVAAIVITIRQGSSNNCHVEMYEKRRASRHGLQRNVRWVIDLLFGTAPSPMVSQLS